MTARNAARGCAPKKATAACSARSARSLARRSRRVCPFTDERARSAQGAPSVCVMVGLLRRMKLLEADLPNAPRLATQHVVPIAPAFRVFSAALAAVAPRKPAAKVWSRLWFFSRPVLRNAEFSVTNRQCRLHPQKRTFVNMIVMSAMCQSLYSIASSGREQQRWNFEAECFARPQLNQGLA